MSGQKELPTLYGDVASGKELALTNRGSTEILALRDKVPFEALRLYAWEVLCVTLDEPFLQDQRLGELSAFHTLQSHMEKLKDYGKDRAASDWRLQVDYMNKRDVTYYHAYPDVPRFGRYHEQAVSGMLLLEFPELGPTPKMGGDFGHHINVRLSAIARRLEEKFGETLKEGRTKDVLMYLMTVRYLTLARKWTLQPLAAKINHLQTRGLVRHTNEETYPAYVASELEKEIKYSEPNYFIATAVKQRLAKEEAQLFGTDSRGRKLAELWKAALFIRNLRVDEEWNLIEKLLDGDLEPVIAKINAVVAKDDRLVPFFMAQKIQRHPDWFESLNDVQTVDFI